MSRKESRAKIQSGASGPSIFRIACGLALLSSGVALARLATAESAPQSKKKTDPMSWIRSFELEQVVYHRYADGQPVMEAEARRIGLETASGEWTLEGLSARRLDGDSDIRRSVRAGKAVVSPTRSEIRLFEGVSAEWSGYRLSGESMTADWNAHTAKGEGSVIVQSEAGEMRVESPVFDWTAARMESGPVRLLFRWREETVP